MRILLIIFCCLGLATDIFAQNKSKKDPDRARKTEVGLNITSSLAGFFNSGGDQIPLDPFLVSLKLVNKKNALRVGFNLRTHQEDESQTGLDGTRTRFDTRLDARFGWEFRAMVAKKFGMHWGLDVLGRYKNNKVDFNSSIGLATQKTYEAGAGGGPFLGMTWTPVPRIVFGTEATLYGTVFQKNETREIPLEPVSTKKSVGFDLASIPPTSLYVHFKF